MLHLLFALAIIFLAIKTSYTDIKYGLIKNNDLLIGIILALTINIGAFIYYFPDINTNAYFHYFINSIFILVLSFIFWNIGLWTAGDAKLFFVLNLLVPPSMIEIGYAGMFYGLVFFINIFGVLLFYFFFLIAKKISKKELKYAITKTFKLKELFLVLVFVFGFGILSKYLTFIPSNFFITILIFFIILTILQLIFKKHLLKVLFGFAILRAIIDFHSLGTARYWIQFLKIVLTLIFMRFILLRLSYFALTKKVKVRNLTTKMFLAEDIVPVIFKEENEQRKEILKRTNKHQGITYMKQSIEYLTLFTYLQNKPFTLKGYDKNRGLSEKNLNWIHKQRNRFQFRSIRIYDTMPFALFISAGVLITILVKGNIFMIIMILLRGLQ